MTLISGGNVIGSYAIALGSNPLGDKQREGDGRTPEGRYTIEGRNAESAFHLSLKISYPDASDHAAAQGVSPGGDIFIHGTPNWWIFPGQPPGDWTRGCIAVTKAEIEEIWNLVPDSTAPLLLSSEKTARVFGVLVAAAVAVTYVFFSYAYISVFCFGGAVMSL